MGGDRAAGGLDMSAGGGGAAPTLPPATPGRGEGTQVGMTGSFLGGGKQGSEWVAVTWAGKGSCLSWERVCG